MSQPYAEVPAFIDPVNAAAVANMFSQTAAITQHGFSFVSEQARANFLSNANKVDMREATAMQEVRTSSQAREILQANAAQLSPTGVKGS